MWLLPVAGGLLPCLAGGAGCSYVWAHLALGANAPSSDNQRGKTEAPLLLSPFNDEIHMVPPCLRPWWELVPQCGVQSRGLELHLVHQYWPVEGGTGPPRHAFTCACAGTRVCVCVCSCVPLRGWTVVCAGKGFGNNRICILRCSLRKSHRKLGSGKEK